MAEVRLSAELRTEFGKGGARRTRRAGKIPAVLYGHGAEPQHISLPARDFTNALKRGGSNVLLTLDIEGVDALALPKAIQRHAIRNEVEHVDLIAVRLGEKVTIDVRLEIVGDVVSGGLISQEFTTVSLEAEATHLPTGLEVNIAGVAVGTRITAGDLVLPAGSVLAGDPDLVLIVISEAASAEALEAAGGGESVGQQLAEAAAPSEA